MKSSRRVIGVAVGLLSVIGACCAAVSSVNAATAVSAEAAREQVQMRSSSGRSYTVTFYSSRGTAAGSVQRVVYALDDATVVPAALAAMARTGVPTLLVAIQASDPAPFAQYDFTPTSRRTEPNVPGGAESFLHFIIDELQPAVARRTGEHADRVVVGAGRAGLWVLYGLINEPKSFDGYVAFDPALDWDQGLILNPNLTGRLGAKLETQRRAARVVLVSQPQPPNSFNNESFSKMFATLNKAPGVTAQIEQAATAKNGVELLADAIERAFMLKARAKPAASRPAIQQAGGIAIPGAREYLQLTPQQRYDLRIKVRALPREQHDVWNEQFKYNLDAGLWFDAHRALHDERVRMDEEHGTAPVGEAPAKPAGVTGTQVAAGAAGTREVGLSNSEQWDLRASGSGREYRVFVAWPARPAPPSGYRVLYVMDGNAMFFTAVEAVRASERRPDSGPDALTVVVGVGYPAGVNVNVARTLDLTFPGNEARLRAPSGGADAFLDFLQKDVAARLAERFTIDSRHQSIFGHSFGGLFVLHTLATRPTAFQTYIAASPSIWYAGEAIKKQLAALGERGLLANGHGSAGEGGHANKTLAIRVLLTAGEYEQVLSPAARSQPDADRAAADLKARAQVDNGRQVAAALNALPGIKAEFVEFSGEDHGSVIPAALGRGVRFMLGN